MKLNAKTSISGRQEQVVEVRCSKSVALTTVDFEPTEIRGVSGVYATRCRVIPNIEGVFFITMLNVNTETVELDARKFIGFINDVSETVAETSAEDDFPDVFIGEQLSEEQKRASAPVDREISGRFRCQS